METDSCWCQVTGLVLPSVVPSSSSPQRNSKITQRVTKSKVLELLGIYHIWSLFQCKVYELLLNQSKSWLTMYVCVYPSISSIHHKLSYSTYLPCALHLSIYIFITYLVSYRFLFSADGHTKWIIIFERPIHFIHLGNTNLLSNCYIPDLRAEVQ